VYKDSADLSQTGIQIDNGPKDQIDSIVVCYSVAPSFAGDTFARFHVSWVSHGIFGYMLCYLAENIINQVANIF
jgi:hypothetical protein